MVCVAAFILLAAQGNQEQSRMVFAVNDFSYPNYGVFQLPPDGQFPVPKDPHIVTTKTVVDHVGTYAQLYCSHRWRDYSIISKISDDLVDISEDARYAFESSVTGKNNCRNEIHRRIKDKSKTKYFNILFGHTLPRWSTFGSTSCTAKAIADLACDGTLNVQGKYRNFAPPSEKAALTIVIDKPFELSDLVYQSQIYIGSDWQLNQRAFAWYQGHLHIFKKTKQGSWLPFTDLGLERHNGDLIYSHMLQNNQLFSETHRNLVGYVSGLAGGHEFLDSKLRDPNFLDYVDTQESNIKRHVEQVKIGRLSPASIHATQSYISDQKPFGRSRKAKKIHNLNYDGPYAPRQRLS